MSGSIYDKLPEHLTREIGLYIPQGGRFRFAPIESPHNPVNRKDRNVRICEKKLAGKTPRNIAIEENLSERHVMRILKENGLSGKPTVKKDRREQLVELLACNYTRKRIAEMLGISRQRLYQILKEEGFK